MSDMSAQLNCEGFGIAALEAAHAIVRQPTPLLRKLHGSVRSPDGICGQHSKIEHQEPLSPHCCSTPVFVSTA